jgi:hypothetical protein
MSVGEKNANEKLASYAANKHTNAERLFFHDQFKRGIIDDIHSFSFKF